MANTGTHKGHNYVVSYATDNDWPVTSVRVMLRRTLPVGVAVHPRDATPWSSGRISPRPAATGDGAFDNRFGVRADRPADLKFLGPEVRGALRRAYDDHPGLWLGHDGLVCVERGHLRDKGRLTELLDELVQLAVLVAGAADGGGTARRAEGGAAHRAKGGAERRAEAEREPAPAAASFRIDAEPAGPAASAAPGDVQAFIRACFDRRVASYEVNRRMKQEWLGRKIHGHGRVLQSMPLGGHDFDFADLKGHRFELQVAGPEELAPHVRVRLQVEPSGRAAADPPQPGQTVRFEGQLLAANPLLFLVQLVSAELSASR
ncbi:MAG: hypothetical protein JXB32_18320 [Deltaproteobacteria bacterium]|nr:hypothetical protein [Deltaproteobacteria bacterium]